MLLAPCIRLSPQFDALLLLPNQFDPLLPLLNQELGELELDEPDGSQLEKLLGYALDEK